VICLIRYYSDYFLDKNTKEPFTLLCSTVCLNLLCFHHTLFLRDGAAVEIKDLPQDKKEKYWDIAKKFQTETDKRIKASTAAYVLELITSTY